jgi:hypothetical protein
MLGQTRVPYGVGAALPRAHNQTTQLGSEYAPSLTTWLSVDASRSNMELVAIASRPNVGLDLDASMPNQVRLRACPDPRWVVFGLWTDPSG